MHVELRDLEPKFLNRNLEPNLEEDPSGRLMETAKPRQLRKRPKLSGAPLIINKIVVAPTLITIHLALLRPHPH